VRRSAASRKTHGPTAPDVDLPAMAPGTECRSGVERKHSFQIRGPWFRLLRAQTLPEIKYQQPGERQR